MFLPEQLPELRRRIRAQAGRDKAVLDDLVAQAREMAGGVRPIRPRSATSVALTAADGGNNAVTFNPFALQIVRIVDSQGKELFLDVVSPASDIGELSRAHLDAGRPRSVLGRMMADLGVSDLRGLSPVLSGRSPRWVESYRELCEWATLYDLVCYHDFAADTLVVHDGLLRTKVFAGDLLIRLGRLMGTAIDRVAREDRRRVWLAGLAKRTAVLDRYRLAMSLAGIFDRGTPCFVRVPAHLQEDVYRWNDYVRGPVSAAEGATARSNIGEMYFVRFGARSGDPVWTADVLAWQAADAQTIFGYLQADASAGFPVPFYPLSLQEADAHSRVADLDVEIVENSLVDAVRELVGRERAHVVDALRLTTDVAARRYA
ncbi:MAG: hypothetical protein JOY82_22880 [Streptosporangiaceae bacterium]|nr:hypothetical protein [Streptosporangiaceae bacterium]MBV9857326.1 hypothetical protein [Streptosporangiaceae bacterium]